MKSSRPKSLKKTDKRTEPRKRCSVYVNFASGYEVGTARIVDYSDSGLGMQTSEFNQLGPTIEVLDAEAQVFNSKSGRVVWQRLREDGIREFGIQLKAPVKEAMPERDRESLWESLQLLAFELSYA